MSAAAILIWVALGYASLGWATVWLVMSPAHGFELSDRVEALDFARRLARAGLALVTMGLVSLGAAL